MVPEVYLEDVTPDLQGRAAELTVVEYRPAGLELRRILAKGRVRDDGNAEV